MGSLAEVSFPPLRATRVVHEDDEVVVVDKPPFVPSQEAREGAGDDLPSRVRRFLAARDGAAPALGVHQRLDAATSGLVVYAKRASANAWLARAFEERTAEKTYLAAVAGARLPDRARLDDTLVSDGGRVRVAPPGARGGVRAVTEIRVLARRGERALVECRIETGKTHQIRAQLAHRGAPIAGDPWYGGAPWPRLCLASVALALPREGGALRASIAPPRALEDFVEGRARDVLTDAAYADEVLAIAAERRYALAHAEDTTCFRWLNEAADGAEGLALDVYGEHLVLHVYRDEAPLDALLDRLAQTGARGVYVKHRPKKASALDDATTRALAPELPARGEPAPVELTVREGGVPLAVRLGDGLSTGLFLDQRENRARVRALAAGQRVLNLFSYTCAFSIAAASGGAQAVLSVDAAEKQLARGRAGFALAGLDPAIHETIADDAFAVLARLARRGRRFDVVIVDPPTYSTTKRTRFTSGRMWVELAAQVLAVLAPGGVVIATSNDRRATQRSLRLAFQDAARAAGVRLAQCKDLPAPVDFPALPGHEPHLHGVLVRT
jgi:23S rRNA (cytosine1962-C5)-methyltransferase